MMGQQAGDDAQVMMRFPQLVYTLRSNFYTLFVRSLLLQPPTLEGVQLQF